VLERLNALSLMQQTGSSDNEAVQAFCRELTEIRQLIEVTQVQSREAVHERLAAIGQQLSTLAEASTDADPGARLDKLCQSMADLQQQLAALQSASPAASSSDHDALLKRLDQLADAVPPVIDHSPLLATILEQLQETRHTVDKVREQAAEQATSQEAVIAELRAALEASSAALQAERSADGSSGGEALALSLRSEIESLRKTADEARQQTQRQETERALVEAELDRVRTQAAQWRRELEEQSAHYHEEERLWHEELQDLRHLMRQAAAAMVSPGQGAAGNPGSEGKTPDAADPVASSLLAQFTKLQKDSARRRTRSQ
jgi:hypothetical protein